MATAAFVRGEAKKDEGEEDGARREKDVVDGVAPLAKGAVGTGAVGGYGGDGYGAIAPWFHPSLRRRREMT